jgi:hypothetical protein
VSRQSSLTSLLVASLHLASRFGGNSSNRREAGGEGGRLLSEDCLDFTLVARWRLATSRLVSEDCLDITLVARWRLATSRLVSEDCLDITLVARWRLATSRLVSEDCLDITLVASPVSENNKESI